jgi:4-aminobutyrate aminotransferase/(S)-3-amino-2-methylpropionate transaminase
MYDAQGNRFLDLQMWYSAVNFGYANPRLNNALKRQIDTLPQVASQYLHREKIELAAMIAQDAESASSAARAASTSMSAAPRRSRIR